MGYFGVKFGDYGVKKGDSYVHYGDCGVNLEIEMPEREIFMSIMVIVASIRESLVSIKLYV